MNIHQKIKLARMLSGYRQSDLAEILDVKQSVIARYEREEQGRKPRTDAIMKIAEATGWPVDWFENDQLEGLIACNLTLPNIVYSETGLATIERGLRALLPVFLSQPLFNDVQVIYVYNNKHRVTDSFYVIYNNKICLLFYASKKLVEFMAWIIHNKKRDDKSIICNRDDIFFMVKNSQYGDDINIFLHELGVPENLILKVDKSRSYSQLSSNLISKIVVEVSAASDDSIELLKKVKLALEKEHIKVHSIKGL